MPGMDADSIGHRAVTDGALPIVPGNAANYLAACNSCIGNRNVLHSPFILPE